MTSNTKEQLNIVVIDDESKFRDGVVDSIINSKSLSARNPVIYNSSHGIEGLGLIYSIDPDVIIIDLSLPKYDEREVYEYIASSPKFKDKNVIIMNDLNHLSHRFPKNFQVIHKSKNNFFDQIIDQII